MYYQSTIVYYCKFAKCFFYISETNRFSTKALRNYKKEKNHTMKSRSIFVLKGKRKR